MAVAGDSCPRFVSGPLLKSSAKISTYRSLNIFLGLTSPGESPGKVFSAFLLGTFFS
jgi:hypothetical protein